MKKQITFAVVAILIVSILNNAVAQKIKLLKKTHLTDYPSASSLEFYKDKLYVIGDDAPSIWILDNEHIVRDSILLFPSKDKRIDRAIKPDLESSAIIRKDNKDYLVCFSSFSTSNRNKIVFVDLSEKENFFNILETNLQNLSVDELNIEGATAYRDDLLISNRANLTHRNNSLIITSINLDGFERKNEKIITFLLPKKKDIIGISGITYVEEKDILLFTASTEKTPNAYTDGTIGTSYIGFIKNFSKKMDRASIKADKLISISKYLKEKAAQKIESLAVEKIDGKKAIVHLAADNDNGESTLFKLKLSLD